jgi:ankyrin repeat protein
VRDWRDRTPLHSACDAAADADEVAALLLEHGAGKNVTDREGRTPLHLACARGHFRTVGILLGKGARTDVQVP